MIIFTVNQAVAPFVNFLFFTSIIFLLAGMFMVILYCFRDDERIYRAMLFFTLGSLVVALAGLLIGIFV